MEEVSSADLGVVEVTAKLFLPPPPTEEGEAQQEGEERGTLHADAVKSSIEALCRSLAVPQVDLLVLSGMGDGDFGNAHTRATWQAAETLVGNGMVDRLAVADCSASQLQALLANATVTPAAVSVDRLAATDPALSDAAVAANIDLLSHDDRGEMLPQKTLKQLLDKALAPAPVPDRPLTEWVLRYGVVDTTRSVIRQLGFVVSVAM